MNEKKEYSDEINLYELILVLKRRIKYIVTVFIAGVFIEFTLFRSFSCLFC